MPYINEEFGNSVKKKKVKLNPKMKTTFLGVICCIDLKHLKMSK